MRQSAWQRPQTRASLRFTGFSGDPEDFARRIRLLGARWTTEGAPYVTVTGRPSRTGKVYAQSMVFIDSSADPFGVLEDVIADVITQAEASAKAIRALPESIDRSLYCTIIPGRHIPIIELSPSILSRISDLGIRLIVDVLDLQGG